MPDFNPQQGPGQGPMRRAVPGRGPIRHYGPGGLPSEGVDPAPKPWPIAPWIALICIVGFLGLQLWPATHYRHPADKARTWHPINRDGGILEGQWNPSFVEESVDPREGNDGFEDIRTTTMAAKGMNSPGLSRKRRGEDVNIFLCTDEKDLRPLVVVINSTISNAGHPEKIKFHLLIPTSESKLEYYKLKSFFPSVFIEISEGVGLEEISKHIKYRQDSKSREELSTPYNFLPYYIPRLFKDKNIDKFIYLDTDVVVKGDIEELFFKSLEGYPVAAVKDCSQLFKSYFDFQQLKEIHAREKDLKSWLPREPFDEEECVFNRGTLLVDVKLWIEKNITEAIEWWMEEYKISEKVLYKYGLSQPPFLLALYKKYKILDHPWNVRGLGRDQFSALEQEYFAELYGGKPSKMPFLSLESDYAKILHFNGKFKPWKRNRVRAPTENVVSRCGQEGQECYELWWEYLSPSADEAFRHSMKQT